jgi:hypothetical protein
LQRGLPVDGAQLLARLRRPDERDAREPARLSFLQAKLAEHFVVGNAFAASE